MSQVARVTRLELATSGVTGRRSNQLSYTRVFVGLHRLGARPLGPADLTVNGSDSHLLPF